MEKSLAKNINRDLEWLIPKWNSKGTKLFFSIINSLSFYLQQQEPIITWAIDSVKFTLNYSRMKFLSLFISLGVNLSISSRVILSPHTCFLSSCCLPTYYYAIIMTKLNCCKRSNRKAVCKWSAILCTSNWNEWTRDALWSQVKWRRYIITVSIDVIAHSAHSKYSNLIKPRA